MPCLKEHGPKMNPRKVAAWNNKISKSFATSPSSPSRSTTRSNRTRSKVPCLQWELFAPSQSLEAVVFGSGRYNGGGSTFSASILGRLGKPWRNGGLNRLNHVTSAVEMWGFTQKDRIWICGKIGTQLCGKSTVDTEFRFANLKRLRWGRSWLERQRLVLDRRILTEPKIRCFGIWIWFDHLRWEEREMLQLILTRMEPEHAHMPKRLVGCAGHGNFAGSLVDIQDCEMSVCWAAVCFVLYSFNSYHSRRYSVCISSPSWARSHCVGMFPCRLVTSTRLIWPTSTTTWSVRALIHSSSSRVTWRWKQSPEGLTGYLWNQQTDGSLLTSVLYKLRSASLGKCWPWNLLDFWYGYPNTGCTMV